MTGVRVVFDRERKILGWKKFNCKQTVTNALFLRIVESHLLIMLMICFCGYAGYDTDSSNPLSINSRNSSRSTPENYSPQETKNPAGASQLRHVSSSPPVVWWHNNSLLLMMFVLLHLLIF
uniref:Peptidase A1 domain-containing protein n=1 Tax=Aegilops tauschii subsp. strangulata TaxID=200361 RepID=A0A453AGF8_AEGTS